MNALSNGQPHELYRKYRPRSLKEMRGQQEAVRVLSDFLEREEVPHALLFTGPSGCGKTTAARILKESLECSDTDFCEINAADSRGIDTVREIRQSMGLAPLGGKCRIWLLDEAHQLTKRSGGDAQTALLKLLEDPPSHAYFMLCTTAPDELLKTIRTRCTEVRMQSLDHADMLELLVEVSGKAKIGHTDAVLERIIEVADGSARKALVLLDQIASVEDEQEALDIVLKSDTKKQAVDLARCLINPGAKWEQASAILRDMEDEPETVRRLILGYASSVALKGGKLTAHAIDVLDAFRDNTFDCGKAGLVLAAYRALHQR